MSEQNTTEFIEDVTVDTATHLELYKEYITEELAENREDFMLFSDWRDKNSELLS